MNVWFVCLIGLGGFLGAVCRYLVGQTVSKTFPSSFPYGTLTINLAGCFLVGWLTSVTVAHEPLRLIWGIGFLGAFTTFSTLKWESFQMVVNRNFRAFFVYSALTYLLGWILAYVGYCVGIWIHT